MAGCDIDRATEWLLANGSAPVKYLTQRHIARTDPASGVMKALWREVETCDSTREIFAKQNADGAWCSGGSWARKPSYLPKDGYSAYSPKYATTVWVLSILGDMGFTISDPRVRRACDFTMTFQWPNGYFGRPKVDLTSPGFDSPAPPNVPCHFAGYLAGLGKVGMGADTRLTKSYDLLVRWQREDGGYLNEGHRTGKAAPYKVWGRSCPWVSFFAAAALFHSGRPDHKGPRGRVLEFLLKHLDGKTDEEIRRFYYHGHETIKEMVMFSDTGVGLGSRPVQVLQNWLASMYDPASGYFRYRGKPISRYTRRADGHTPDQFKYRLFHLIEDDWLTYYAVRVLRKYEQD